MCQFASKIASTFLENAGKSKNFWRFFVPLQDTIWGIR